jgi:hypothetical protein
MLTSEQCKLRLRFIISLTLVAVLLLAVGIVIIIIANYYGISVNDPFNCATASQAYFVVKYTSKNYLTASFLGIILSLAFSLTLLFLLIPRLVRINKLSENEAEEQTLQII